MRIKLDIPLTIYEISAFVSGISHVPDNTVTIKYITLDSRLIQEGDIFIPLKGERFDGNDFLDDAARKGAIVIAESIRENAITVKRSDHCLLKIAGGYKRKLCKLKHTIAVTGSVGKTTTKAFLCKLLEQKFITHSNEENYNNTVGVPITVLKAKADTEVLIAEAGMNHPGELALISECLNPDIAVITNIGTAHIGNLGNRENIAKAKKEIIGADTKTVFIPFDEPLLDDVPNAIGVSAGNPNSSIYLSAPSVDDTGSSGDVYKNGKRLLSFNIKIPGKHNLECLKFAVAVCDGLSMTPEMIKAGIDSLSTKDIRQRYISFNSFSVYDDSYNSSPEALASAFKFLSLCKAKAKSALVGDMLELGSRTQELHFEAGALAAGSNIRKLYLFGVYSPFVMEGAVSAGMNRDDILINTDTTAPQITAKQILENREEGEVILFKASHSVNLSRVCEHIRLLEG